MGKASSNDEAQRRLELRRRISSMLAPAMFFLSLLFLAVTAALIVVWVDMPRMAEEGSATAQEVIAQPGHFRLENAALQWSEIGIALIGLIWPLFLAEFALQFFLRDPAEPFWRTRYFSVLICFVPPLRMCARNPDHDDMIWLPRAGWCEVNERLRESLERTFAIPMIFIALLILPVLGIEFGMHSQVVKYTWLRVLLHISTGVIWFAFAAEFILMLSVADKKLRYCREHWIDLAIIVLPLLSFLRSLRVVRAMRLAKFAKVQQLSRMGRLYRLRGLAMRAFRAILLLELLDRFIRTDPEKRLMRYQEELAEKEREIKELRELIASAEKEIAARASSNEDASSPDAAAEDDVSLGDSSEATADGPQAEATDKERQAS